MAARHQRPAHLENASLEEIAETYIAKFETRVPDWDAFSDANIDGYRRAQHRFIGAGASGKHDAAGVIPAENFTLSIMLVPPGQGNAPHTHEVEEVFFILKGRCVVFIDDEDGRRVSKELGPWECISCPAGVIHGYVNETDEDCYLQVVLGRGRPDVAGFADQTLFENRERHLKD
ncbi:cupin domain-containing protein [Caulobacter sp. RHG1]|uniref:cupin domain-containing protein n=1 Tax=Caulobacter sp. (strain RHG1) TaxID=2545762 RepID=UPI0015533DB2|nr:cupin domain-containing protein [Caulobacter sp. RHG1]NQE63639.1 Mannose-6-phosphate isomerase [Caulobacter sp. RHG1]